MPTFNIKRAQGVLPLLIILGFMLSCWGVALLYTGFFSLSWPSTSGFIVSSSVQKYSNGVNTTYQPKVSYEYWVDGESFSSQQISFSSLSSVSSDVIQGIVDKYPSEGEVTVYYNPASPRTAILEPGVSIGGLLILGLGIFLFGIAIYGKKRQSWPGY